MCVYIYIERKREQIEDMSIHVGREGRAGMSVASSPFIDRSQQKMFKIGHDGKTTKNSRVTNENTKVP